MSYEYADQISFTVNGVSFEGVDPRSPYESTISISDAIGRAFLFREQAKITATTLDFLRENVASFPYTNTVFITNVCDKPGGYRFWTLLKRNGVLKEKWIEDRDYFYSGCYVLRLASNE